MYSLKSILQSLEYIQEKRGLNSERKYPWTGKKEECKAKPKKKFGIIKIIAKLGSNSIQSLKAALSRGPVIVFVYGGTSAFKNYKGGNEFGNSATVVQWFMVLFHNRNSIQ